MKSFNLLVISVVTGCLLSCSDEESQNIDELKNLSTDKKEEVIISKVDTLHELPIANSQFPVLAQTVIDFDYGIAAMNSGCTKLLLNSDIEPYTYTGVYGPIPYLKSEGYKVRGYGEPYHNPSAGKLTMLAWNEGVKVTDAATGDIVNRNKTNTMNVLSIEYPFEANYTYEITVRAKFDDRRPAIDNTASVGFPTVTVSLMDSPVIVGPDPCSDYYNQPTVYRSTSGRTIIALLA